MPIKIELTADTVDGLTDLIADLAALAPKCLRITADTGPTMQIATNGDGKVTAIIEASDMGVSDELDPNAEVVSDEGATDDLAAAPKAKSSRGRPAGAKNKPKEEPKEEPPGPADPDSLDYEAKVKLRNDAVQLIVSVWARGAAGLKAVKDLQAHYGCVKFTDLDPDFAPQLYAHAVELDKRIKI